MTDEAILGLGSSRSRRSLDSLGSGLKERTERAMVTERPGVLGSQAPYGLYKPADRRSVKAKVRWRAVLDDTRRKRAN